MITNGNSIVTTFNALGQLDYAGGPLSLIVFSQTIYAFYVLYLLPMFKMNYGG